MFGRRAFILSLAGAGVTPALAHGAPRSLRERSIAGDGPKPSVIKGQPPKMDFGDGLQVPLDRDAFVTLWEDSGRWITFGLGLGRAESDSNAKADKAASLTMQIMLLTLAYAPERLERVNGGGWRPRSGKLRDLVMGDVPLPGQPVRPAGGVYMDDRLFAGRRTALPTMSPPTSRPISASSPPRPTSSRKPTCRWPTCAPWDEWRRKGPPPPHDNTTRSVLHVSPSRLDGETCSRDVA